MGGACQRSRLRSRMWPKRYKLPEMATNLAKDTHTLLETVKNVAAKEKWTLFTSSALDCRRQKLTRTLETVAESMKWGAAYTSDRLAAIFKHDVYICKKYSLKLARSTKSAH